MSSYVEKTLGDGEDVVFRAHFNWTYSFWPTVWFLIALAPAPLLAYVQFKEGLGFSNTAAIWGWGAAGIAALVGGLNLLFHLIVLWTTEIAVTTYRFVYKTGLISRHTQEVSLNKIEEITLSQSIWGRLFNYGGLTMRGTGVGVIELPNIDDPIRVRRVVENAKSALRSGGDVSPADED